ncbi:MAG: hypothetical protein AAB250_04975 [Bdellovibrionota bacterium]
MSGTIRVAELLRAHLEKTRVTEFEIDLPLLNLPKVPNHIGRRMGLDADGIAGRFDDLDAVQ